MPVIEVQFAHLGDVQHSVGRLTLLDTPGPNESGQEHLRAMLTEQLQKASAVLAILDFTQLKSDADEQVRQELKDRSEEHTYELQSLMRISYADFCLKKHKYTKKQ